MSAGSKLHKEIQTEDQRLPWRNSFGKGLLSLVKSLMTCIIKLKLNWLLTKWILLYLEVLSYCAALLQSQKKKAKPCPIMF